MHEKTILDPMYGPLKHEGEIETMAWAFYQTKALARLRDISLSSVPARMSMTGHAPSRFEHSVGVAYLARELCKHKPSFAPYKKELTIAALLHDSASVPFSHIGEIFQYDALGKTHEQAVEEIIASEEIEKLFKKYKLDGEEVLSLIEGRHPVLGTILAGSIDLDNLDNSARLLRAFGYSKEPPYNPEALLRAFRIKGGRLGLTATSDYIKDLLGWVECRQQLYGEILYGPAKQAAACMLYRALEYTYAAGKIKKSFFQLGESEAMSYLLSKAPPEAAWLTREALNWRPFNLAWEYVSPIENPRIRHLGADWQIRKLYCDRLAKALKTKPERVTIHAGRDKGLRPIHLPFWGEDADAAALLFSRKLSRQRLSIFVADGVKFEANRLAETALELLQDIPEGADDGHSFF